MAVADWPSTLPQSPLIKGYSETDVENRLITKVAGGAPKVRVLYDAVPTDITFKLLLTTAEVDILDDFYRNILKFGSLKFNWQAPRRTATKLYRFVSPPEKPSSPDGEMWQVNISLQEIP